jgi:hypothetical protein
LTLAVPDDVVAASAVGFISSARIVSSQFLSDLFSVFMALRNYSPMLIEHFSL